MIKSGYMTTCQPWCREGKCETWLRHAECIIDKCWIGLGEFAKVVNKYSVDAIICFILFNRREYIDICAYTITIEREDGIVYYAVNY